MAAQAPFINIRKYTLVCIGRRGRRVERGRIMELFPLGKEEGQKSIFTTAFLGFKWGLGKGSMEKSRNLNNVSQQENGSCIPRTAILRSLHQRTT